MPFPAPNSLLDVCASPLFSYLSLLLFTSYLSLLLFISQTYVFETTANTVGTGIYISTANSADVS